jgi:hypothetical protein
MDGYLGFAVEAGSATSSFGVDGANTICSVAEFDSHAAMVLPLWLVDRSSESKPVLDAKIAPLGSMLHAILQDSGSLDRLYVCERWGYTHDTKCRKRLPLNRF